MKKTLVTIALLFSIVTASFSQVILGNDSTLYKYPKSIDYNYNDIDVILVDSVYCLKIFTKGYIPMWGYITRNNGLDSVTFYPNQYIILTYDVLVTNDTYNISITDYDGEYHWYVFEKKFIKRKYKQIKRQSKVK